MPTTTRFAYEQMPNLLAAQNILPQILPQGKNRSGYYMKRPHI